METINCSICENQFSIFCKPLVLPCGHTYCKQCLKNMSIASNQIKCPIDKKFVHTDITEIPPNYAVMRCIEAINNQIKMEFLAPPRRKTYSVLGFGNGTTYFFLGDKYYSYNDARDCANPGYPAIVSSFWTGLWPNGIDTCFNYDSNYAYFIKGDKCIKYNKAKMSVEPGYPMKISQCWKGVNYSLMRLLDIQTRYISLLKTTFIDMILIMAR